MNEQADVTFFEKYVKKLRFYLVSHNFDPLLVHCRDFLAAYTRAPAQSLYVYYHAAILMYLGRALLYTKKYDESKAVFDSYTLHYPFDSRGWYFLSRLSAAQKDYQGAKLFLEQSIEYDPTNYKLLVRRFAPLSVASPPLY